MIRNFFSTPNVIGRLFIVLLFASGVVFAGAFDGFVVETQASSCCGGGTDASIFSSSGNNGGGGGGGNKCGCLGDTTDCGCGTNPACGGSTTDYCGTCKCLSSCCTEKQCKAYASCDSDSCTHSAD